MWARHAERRCYNGHLPAIRGLLVDSLPPPPEALERYGLAGLRREDITQRKRHDSFPGITLMWQDHQRAHTG